jgi:hypothetical protein
MPKAKFCFVQTSPFGQSKEAQRVEQLRARTHAASVSPRRRRTSFQILHDVLGPPGQELDVPTTAYRRPASPPSPDGDSPDKINQLWPTGALRVSYSARPLSPPDSPEALKEEQHEVNEDKEASVEGIDWNEFRGPAAAALVVPNRVADLIPSDYRCFRGMRTDPFDCIPARGSESVSSVVDYRAFQHYRTSHCWKYPNPR